MDPGEKKHINNKLTTLMENTTCDTYLLAGLFSQELLHRADMEEIQSTPTNMDRVFKMFTILQRKRGSYEPLMNILLKCGQTGAYDILKEYASRKTEHQPTTMSGVWGAQHIIISNQIPREALHMAVRSGNVEALKTYISGGANVNEQTHTWNTPLHELQHTRQNFVALTKILLDHGGLPDALNKANDNVAHQISINKHITPIEYHDWVSFVLSRGCGNLWHHKGWRGRTPLHSAMATMDPQKCTIEMILKETGMDVNEKNGYGNTTLLLAVGFGRSRHTLACLVELGANENTTDKQKNGVLHKAICNSDVDAAQFFISVGAEIDARNCGGETPLHMVLRSNKHQLLKLTQLLLDAGADLEQPNGKGKTISDLLKFQLSRNKYSTWIELVGKYKKSRLAGAAVQQNKFPDPIFESTVVVTHSAEKIRAKLNTNLLRLVEKTVINVTLECYLRPPTKKT